MIITQKQLEQCRLQLELERDTLECRLQQHVPFGEEGNVDPFNLSMLRQARAQLQCVNRALEHLTNNKR